MTSTSSSEQRHAPQQRSIDQSKIAYQKPQPVGMVPDIFIGPAMQLDGDEREWVPQSETTPMGHRFPGAVVIGHTRHQGPGYRPRALHERYHSWHTHSIPQPPSPW
jgi:hypothetical protein